MKYIETIFQCKVCKDAMKLHFQKPSLLGKTRFPAECSVCGTEYHIVVKIQPGTNKNGLDVEASFRKPIKRDDMAGG